MKKWNEDFKMEIASTSVHRMSFKLRLCGQKALYNKIKYSTHAHGTK